MSIDGRIALKNGESKWITSLFSRKDVQIFRAKSSVILSSSSTILRDDPFLNVRYNLFNKKMLSTFPKKIFKHPIRVIIDSKNQITPFHKIINTKGEIWLIRIKPDNQLWPKNVTQKILKPYKNKINLVSLFKLLGKLEINNIWIEAGSTLSGSLLKLKLIDEIIIYIAPKILGHEAKPLFILPDKSNLIKCIPFNFHNICQIGPDIRLTLIRQ
ncbi:bifunctional diaminohydroxyphosphoribosylaminopyrimidine deaminase/5-amino-6-(5-phosphoribosylamino)uracil reductase RibD [Buchnera aphidicola (Muscaphis stroyani)]|uniref:5-amino-6-(5-phosphoribosylamino)uracil reductase n=1 Tax=Buchnera aphidicola (Muscaphis stroyani) TaxID=1241869 RepID=A0A4D6Y506_9GAMM|nr:bifunctional diaminohydroxyphosphoribosylaminopyrimidine deaminase/5-amino-6-(5-phosphoribosylamino)uracil reductase RibD [Buchnera aphidicola (Muscaphis stroyani)]